MESGIPTLLMKRNRSWSWNLFLRNLLKPILTNSEAALQLQLLISMRSGATLDRINSKPLESCDIPQSDTEISVSETITEVIPRFKPKTTCGGNGTFGIPPGP